MFFVRRSTRTCSLLQIFVQPRSMLSQLSLRNFLIAHILQASWTSPEVSFNPGVSISENFKLETLKFTFLPSSIRRSEEVEAEVYSVTDLVSDLLLDTGTTSELSKWLIVEDLPAPDAPVNAEQEFISLQERKLIGFRDWIRVAVK